MPVRQETDRPVPKRIVRPCEWGLFNAVKALETQMRSVEAYNRLCSAAEQLKAKIDAGKGVAQHPMWATDPKMIYPAGGAP
ncbi:hypothetical protein DF107_18070 [Burkholderia stagnalis]|nr:hypothetical protein DF161_07000 [Burkholderia stagnalis]RQY80024.1 hypothetical protein DF107_18070 [Burkholderia stagnalis]